MYTNQLIAGTIIFDGPPVWAGFPLDWLGTLGQWIINLSTHLVGLWHTAGWLAVPSVAVRAGDRPFHLEPPVINALGPTVPASNGEEVISMMLYSTVHSVVTAQADPTPSPAPGCPSLAPGEPGAGVAKAVCSVGGVADAVTGLPTWLWHLVTDNWVRLVGCLLAVVAAGAAWQVWRRWLWRRAVARGSWVEVVAPRETAVTATAAVWRLLSSVAARAGSGAHLVHPPLAVEFHGDGRGQVSLNLWVPKWVPVALVSTEAQRAWPGALVRPFVPPMGGPAWKAAGFAMAVHDTDHEMLVDDVYLRSRLAAAVSGTGDPLRPVFDALRAADGPTVLQALAKPAGSKQINRLAMAARQPAKRRKPLPFKALDLVLAAVTGVFRLLLDLITPGSNHRGSGRGYQPTAPNAPDPLQRLAMRRAADKLKAGPHLMVAIRAVALRPERGWAASEASLLANGYRVAARGLRPKRLWWAKSAVSDRHAARREWFLVTASEMGVLFHLPADPALFGFNVAAAQRRFPHQATRLRPEQTSDTEPGWSRGKWTGPSGTPKTALAMRDHHSEDSDGSAEAEFFDPWGMPLSGEANPHSENNQFIDDDLDSDWDFPYDNE